MPKSATSTTHVLEKVLTKGSNIQKFVVMVGASWDDGVYQSQTTQRWAHLHEEWPILGHVFCTVYVDSRVETSERPIGDLPQDDINNHEVHC